MPAVTLLAARSFYARGAVILAATLAVLLLTQLWLLTPQVTGEVDALIERDREAITELAAHAATGIAGQQHPQQADRLLAAVMRATAAREVRITTGGESSRRAFRSGGQLVFDDKPLNGPPGNTLVRTVSTDTGSATVALVYGEEIHAGFRDRLWRDAGIGFLVALGLGLLLLEFYLRPLARNLTGLAEFADKLDRELGATLPVPRGVIEFERLTDAVNRASLRIAEQKAGIERAQSQLHLALDSLDDGFVIYDSDDRLVLCNERYREIYAQTGDAIRTGVRFEDILREGIRNGQYPQAVGDAEAWVEGRLAAHRAANSVIEQQLPDGRWLRIAERRTPEGGVVGFRVDITALKQAQAQAEAASRAKSDFLANMSHEMRTPLNGVIGMIDLALESPVAPQQAECLELARVSAVSLLDIVNDVLDFSKIEAGRIELESVSFRADQVCHDVVALFAGQARDKGLALRFDAADDLVRPLLSDPFRVRQILVNLIGNAIKFTSSGEVVLAGTSEPVSDGRYRLRLEVSDSGPGIPAEQVERIFEPFTQADATITRRYGGTGLGLSISRRLAEYMGGRIEVTSTPGQGSRFVLDLELPQGVGTEIIGGEDTGSERALAPGHIVVVEDHPINQLVTRRLLERRGWQVEVFADAPAALARLRDADPDFVLMDLQLPGISGIEALNRIRERDATHGRHTRVVALTAHALAGDRERCMAAGMDGYVSKPFTARQLLAELSRVSGHGRTPCGDSGDTGAGRFARAIDSLDGDRELFAELAPQAQAAFTVLREKLDALGAAPDLPQIAAEAHRLKATWAIFAAPHASDLATALERAAEAGDTGRVIDTLRAVCIELDDILSNLAYYISTAKPS